MASVASLLVASAFVAATLIVFTAADEIARAVPPTDDDAAVATIIRAISAFIAVVVILTRVRGSVERGVAIFAAMAFLAAVGYAEATIRTATTPAERAAEEAGALALPMKKVAARSQTFGKGSTPRLVIVMPIPAPSGQPSRHEAREYRVELLDKVDPGGDPISGRVRIRAPRPVDDPAGGIAESRFLADLADAAEIHLLP